VRVPIVSPAGAPLVVIVRLSLNPPVRVIGSCTTFVVPTPTSSGKLAGPKVKPELVVPPGATVSTTTAVCSASPAVRPRSVKL
jgi:hypothetical protein